MKITKAVITAAGKSQRNLPLQTLIDRDGIEKSVLEILIAEATRAGINDIGVVIHPADEEAYQAVVGNPSAQVTFIPQEQRLGYGHAVYCAHKFTAGEPFLHLVGDHLYVSRSELGCAEHLVAVAEKEACSVSAVQATRESQLPFFGTIGGTRLQNQPDLYRVSAVMEKPTPTIAEQHLIVSGLRAGHYLCFFGMHVLTNSVMEILAEQVAFRQATSTSSVTSDPEAVSRQAQQSEAEPAEARTSTSSVTGDSLAVSRQARQLEAELVEAEVEAQPITLAGALAELGRQEKYLALQKEDQRYDLGVKYGRLEAQLALALAGDDRDDVLTKLVGLLAA